MFDLERKGVRLSMLPRHGAAVLGLRFKGEPILHPARPGVEADPTSSACFAMVPWCNRLSAGGISTLDGQVAVAANWPTTAFPVHGHGWLMPWDVVSSDPDHVHVRHRLTAAVGYAYEANMRISLQETGARFDLSLRNDADRPLPYGIGLHPYFPRRPNTALRLNAQSQTRFDALGLPLSDEVITSDTDFRAVRPLGDGEHSALYLDATKALVTGNDLSVALHAGGAFRHLQLWAPKGRDFFCIEPLSHRVDDFSRRATAAPHDLPPGRHLSGWMTLSVADQ